MFESRFQSFDDPAAGAASAPRVAALRTELARRNLTGFIVPRADRHQNEYVPAAEERLAWLTGFTGSAGAAVVMIERAALFVDGRYTLQVREQVDTKLFAIEHLVENPPDQWIEKNLGPGDSLGYDPWLHTVEGAEKLAKACAAAGATLVPIEPNPIDAIWIERPPPPLGAVTLHGVRFAGEEATTKLAQLRPEIGKLKADALVVSDPHAVAWTFNIRGSDVAHTPLPLAFAVVPREGRPALYIDGRKHPDADELEATTNGHSIGRWDGNTLVADTVGLNERGITAIPGGGYRTAKSHLVEQYRLSVDGQQLVVTFTWTDAGVFRRPHVYAFRYYKVRSISEPRVTNCIPNDSERTRFLTEAPAAARF